MVIDQQYMYKLLIYTSIIGAGIDFHLDHFDTMFVFADCRSCSVDGHFQMIGRIRKLKQKRIFYTLYTQNYTFDVSEKVIKWKILERAKAQDGNLDKYLPEGAVSRVNNTCSFSWIPKDDIWFQSYIKLEQKRLINMKDIF